MEAVEVDSAPTETGEVDMDTSPLLPGPCVVQDLVLGRDAKTDQNDEVLSVGEVVDAIVPVPSVEEEYVVAGAAVESVVPPAAFDDVVASVPLESVNAVAPVELVIAGYGAPDAFDVRDLVGEGVADQPFGLTDP